MENAADVADMKYGATHTIVWLLAQSSATRSIMSRQAKWWMVWSSESEGHSMGGGPQLMVNPDGMAKGLRTILQEKGINMATMKADDMRTVLSFHDDFLNENTIIFQKARSPYQWCMASFPAQNS